MDRVYTAVVVGCGKVGAQWGMDQARLQPASHAEAIARNVRLKLVAVVDQDAALAEQVGTHYGAPHFADTKDALALKPDIVVIAVPPQAHEAVCMEALAQNVPAIVCEKPLADTLEAAERMQAAAAHAKSVVIVNHQRRFSKLFKEAQEKIAKGELGRIQQVTAFYTNGLLNNGTHTIDALQYLLGDRSAWAIGVESETNKTAPFGNNIDGLVGFKNGTTVALQSLDNDAYIVHDFEIRGTRGALSIHQYGFRFEWTPAREVLIKGVQELDWSKTEVHSDTTPLLGGATMHAVECLDTGAPSLSTLEDGYQTMRLLDALTRSAAGGGAKIQL